MKRTLLTTYLFLFIFPGVLAHSSATAEGVQVTFRPTDPPQTEQLSLIDIFLQENGAIVTEDQLDVVHERKMHVFIVGQDLRVFAHLHPEDFPWGYANAQDGQYTIQYDFPGAGAYALILDYTINNETHIAEVPIAAAGKTRLSIPTPDYRTSKQYESYGVRLQTPERIEAGKEMEFTYIIERDGLPVRDLQMYLGSEIHVLAIRDDLTNAGHTHAYVEGHEGHTSGMQMYTGPSVPVRYTFSAPGVYALFGQFRAGEELVTTQFYVNVTEPLPSADVAAKEQKITWIVGTIFILAILFVLVVLYFFVRDTKKKR